MHIPRIVAVPVIGVSALIAGCGSTQSSSSAGEKSIAVGVPPIIDSSPYYLAIQKGYFTDAGLTVTTNTRGGEGIAITSLVNGTDQCGFAGTAAILQAAEKGLPVQIVGQLTKITTKPADDTGMLLVGGNSPIATAKDLNGKTVAVGSLKGGGELSLRAAVDASGGDSKTMKIIEIPLPNLAASLKSGQVDAISTISPFDGPAMADGARQILSPGSVAAPDSMQMGVACNADFVKNNRPTLEKFLKALNHGTDDTTGNPDLAKQVLPTYSDIPVDIVKQIKLPVYSSQAEASGVQQWVDLMVKYGFISNPLPLDQVYVKL